MTITTGHKQQCFRGPQRGTPMSTRTSDGTEAPYVDSVQELAGGLYGAFNDAVTDLHNAVTQDATPEAWGQLASAAAEVEYAVGKLQTRAWDEQRRPR